MGWGGGAARGLAARYFLFGIKSSKLDGMADHITIKATHTGLPRHPGAIRQTIAFLSEGRFDSRV